MKYFLIILVLMVIAEWTNSSDCTLHAGDWMFSEQFGRELSNTENKTFNTSSRYFWSVCERSQI